MLYVAKKLFSTYEGILPKTDYRIVQEVDFHRVQKMVVQGETFGETYIKGPQIEAQGSGMLL